MPQIKCDRYTIDTHTSIQGNGKFIYIHDSMYLGK